MKGLQLLLLFCFSLAMAQKQYSLKLHFMTDSNEAAPHVQVTLFKNIEGKEGAVIVNKVTADEKGILNLKLSDDYFDKTGSLTIQAYYYNKDAYYLDYYEKISKKKFPFKKTVKFEHIIPPTLEEINSSSSIPPPPMVPK